MDIFGDFSRVIIFIHIISASLLTGSMFMARFVMKPVLDSIDDEAVRYSRYINILNRYFFYVLIMMLFIITASLTMIVGLGFEQADPTIYSLIHVKEALWVFIAFNFIYMYIKLIQAKKFLKTREFFEVDENIKLITAYLIPLNLILALIAAYIGVIVRGF